MQLLRLCPVKSGVLPPDGGGFHETAPILGLGRRFLYGHGDDHRI